MPRSAIPVASLLLCVLVAVFPASAQLPTGLKDPLNPAQASKNPTACSVSDTSSCAQAAAKILPIVMGPSTMEENLRRLTDEIGGRVTGTPQMAKAIEWGITAFRAAGIDVHTEKYKLPATWSEGDTLLELLAPLKFPVRLKSEGWSPAAPAAGIEASVVDVGYGTDDDFAKSGKALKGAIVLVHTDLGSTWADLFNEYMRPPMIIDRAVKEGATAILWIGARERMLLYRHTNSLTRSRRLSWRAKTACAWREPSLHTQGRSA
jgi:hypothetical protein